MYGAQPGYQQPQGYGAPAASPYGAPPAQGYAAQPGYGAAPAAQGYGTPQQQQSFGLTPQQQQAYGALPQQQGYTPQQQQQVQQMQQMQQMQQRQAAQAAPQAYGQVPQQQAAPAAGGGLAGLDGLNVSGCTNATVGGIVRGGYSPCTENHGKPVYKKDEQVNGLDVLIYFWDERDGPTFCGWWFGPKVGGDQVWAYNPDKNARTPPPGGWKVPYDGPVDTTYQVVPKGGAKPPQYGQQPAQQSFAQQPPQQTPAYGQQAYPQQAAYAQQQSAYGAQAAAAQAQQAQQAAYAAQQQQQQQYLAQQQQQQQQQIQRQQQQVSAVEQQRKAQEEQIRLRQRQEEENRRREQERIAQMKSQQENLRAKREQEVKAREDERKRQQEELRKKREDEIARQKAEMEARRKAEEDKRLEQSSIITIRKTIQKMRMATIDNFDALKTELDECLAAEMPKITLQKDALNTEVTKTKEITQERIDKMREIRKKEEERKAEEERKKKESEDLCEKLLGETEDLVKKCETLKTKMEEVAKPLADVSNMQPNRLTMAASKLEDVVKQAQDACKGVNEFVGEKRPEMLTAKHMIAKTQQELLAKQRRVHDVASKVSELETLTETCKTKAVRKTAVMKYKSDQEKIVNRHTSGLKKFDRKSAAKFAKAEMKYDLPQESIEKIFKRLDPQNQGIKMDKFAKMKTMMGICIEELKTRERRAAEEERKKKEAEDKAARQKLLEEKREVIKGKFEEMSKEMEDVEKENAAAIEKAKPIGQSKPANGLTTDAMFEAADETEKLVDSVKSSLSGIKERFEELQQDLEPELKSFASQWIGKIKVRIARAEGQSNSTMGVAKVGRDKAEKQAFLELDGVAQKILGAIRQKMSEDKKNAEQMFKDLDTKKDGVVDEKEFVAYVKKCKIKVDESEVDDDKLKKIFAMRDLDKKGKITKEDFLRSIRQHYKVVRQAVLTDGLGIKTSKTLRRAEIGEVIEVYEGPMKEGTVDVERINGKMIKDGVVGWVTIKGNQGTDFLVPGGNVYKVLKEVDLTESLDATSKSIRKMKTGEMLEVLEFEQKDESSQVERLKGKCKSDGVVGWVTVAGSGGTVHLEMV